MLIEVFTYYEFYAILREIRDAVVKQFEKIKGPVSFSKEPHSHPMINNCSGAVTQCQSLRPGVNARPVSRVYAKVFQVSNQGITLFPTKIYVYFVRNKIFG